MKLHWSRLALNDFEQATDYIAQDNPTAAQRVAKCILDATHTLQEFPFVGRISDDPDQREWLVRHTPYLLVYEIHADTVYIARLWHVRQEH